MIIFKIGNTDYSEYVNKRKYKADKVDETISWKDANSVIHTTVLRTRVSATVELLFTSETSHQNFVSALSSACTNGYWSVSVYVPNTHVLETFTARIDATTKAVFANAIKNGNPVVSSVVLNIEEV